MLNILMKIRCAISQPPPPNSDVNKQLCDDAKHKMLFDKCFPAQYGKSDGKSQCH